MWGGNYFLASVGYWAVRGVIVVAVIAFVWWLVAGCSLHVHLGEKHYHRGAADRQQPTAEEMIDSLVLEEPDGPFEK